MKRLFHAKEWPLLPLFLLALVILFLFWISLQPDFIEEKYTHFFYVFITRGLTGLTGRFAFSLSEIALYVSILGVILLLGFAVWRQEWQLSLAAALWWAAVTVIWFYLVWGCNYFRLPLVKQLQLDAENLTPDSLALRENLLWSITMTNAAWREIPAWDLKSLNEEIEKSYRPVCATLQIALMPGQRRPKFLLFPGWFNYTLTSGMFGPFFHEIHLNSELLPVELPFVLAHEKAHQMGFAREAEANFLAALACWMSADSAVQYSGSFAVLGHFWSQAAGFSDRDTLRESIRPEVLADFAAVRQRYQKYRGAVSDFSHKSYDVYLRVNRVEGGTKNYNEVTDLIMRWRAWKTSKGGQ